MIVPIITNFCDSIFSQSEVKVERVSKKTLPIQKRGPKSSDKKD